MLDSLSTLLYCKRRIFSPALAETKKIRWRLQVVSLAKLINYTAQYMDKVDNISQDLSTINLAMVESLDAHATGGKTLEFYENSQITRATVYGRRLSGIVGNFLESYQVTITVHQNEISGACTCGRSGKICRHVVALLYSWVNDGRDFLNVGTVLEKVKTMDKDRLIEIVSNIIRQYPNMVDVFLAEKSPEWDEIDPDLNDL